MHSAIQISKINDFTFCPHTLYLHTAYEDFSTALFHDVPQIRGKAVHEPIDQKIYSSRKTILQGIPVYSEEYQLIGKIDLFDTATGELIERKFKVKQIFPGYKYQLYAQMLCLQEAGHEVKSLKIHSLSDNKRYPIPLPNKEELEIFLNVLKEMINYNPEKHINHECPKCSMSIYKDLAWNAL